MVDEFGQEDLICRINSAGIGVGVLGGLEPQPRTYRLVLMGRRGATGRIHAAWWLLARREQITLLEQYTVDAALHGVDMTPEQIDTLARLVLRLAGRV